VPGVVLMLVGSSIQGSGLVKIQNAFKDYCRLNIKLQTMEKYGIVITPYKVNPLTF
jgi:hypothetical protein